MPRNSRAASSATTTATTRSAARGRNTIAASAASASARPLIRRTIETCGSELLARRSLGPYHRAGVDAAIAPLALLECQDRLEQVPTPEVGPERIGDVDLGICDLPEEEVAHAHLPA